MTKIRGIKSVILYLFFIVFLTPFLLVVMNSFKTTQQFTENPFSIPKRLPLANYINAFESMNFIHALMNSFIVTVASVLVIVVFSSMTGYLFVRMKWKINAIIFFIMIASMAIPFQVVMIPLVIIYGNLNLLDTKTVLTFMYMGFGVPLGVFIFHGFIKGIPYEMEESAFMDGASRPRVFFQIVFPLLRPIIVTLVVLDVLWIWNDYLLPSLVLLSPDQRTLPLSMYTFYSTYTVDYGPLMAGLILAIIPVLVLYLFLQKHIIKGITSGAVK